MGLERPERIPAPFAAAVLPFLLADDEGGQRLLRALASRRRRSADRLSLVFLADGESRERRMLALTRGRLLFAGPLGGRAFLAEAQRGRAAFFAAAQRGRLFLTELLRRAGRFLAEAERRENRAAVLFALDQPRDRHFLAHGHRGEDRFLAEDERGDATRGRGGSG